MSLNSPIITTLNAASGRKSPTTSLIVAVRLLLSDRRLGTHRMHLRPIDRLVSSGPRPIAHTPDRSTTVRPSSDLLSHSSPSSRSLSVYRQITKKNYIFLPAEIGTVLWGVFPRRQAPVTQLTAVAAAVRCPRVCPWLARCPVATGRFYVRQSAARSSVLVTLESIDRARPHVQPSNGRSSCVDVTSLPQSHLINPVAYLGSSRIDKFKKKKLHNYYNECRNKTVR